MTDKTTNVQSGYFTQERIQGDLDYCRAQAIAKKMLDNGLISMTEFNKLSAINRFVIQSWKGMIFNGRRCKETRKNMVILF